MRPESSTYRVRIFVHAVSHSSMFQASVAVARARARGEISESRPKTIEATPRIPCDILPGSRRCTNDGARAAVTARSQGERHVKHCRAIMVRSVKDILARSGRTAGRVKHIHVTMGGSSSVPVRKRKRPHYGRHQTIRSWHGCRPGNDAVLAQGLWTDIDPRSGKSYKASPWKPLQRVRRQAGPLRGGAQTL